MSKEAIKEVISDVMTYGQGQTTFLSAGFFRQGKTFFFADAYVLIIIYLAF